MLSEMLSDAENQGNACDMYRISTWASACTRRQLLLGAADRAAAGLKVARVWAADDVKAPFMTADTMLSLASVKFVRCDA